MRYWHEEFQEQPELFYVTGTMPFGHLLVHCQHDAIERFNSSPLGSIGREWPKRFKCEFDKKVLNCQFQARACAISHLSYFSIKPDLEKLKRLVALMPDSVTVRENNHMSSHGD